MITTTYIEHMGNDLTVANAARVSFGKTSEMEENTWGPPTLKAKDAKLIKYLAKHKHYSPFGHCFASFHVQLPVFVARQLVKHKFLRWNEISRRYTSENIKFYKPKVWRGKAVDKKQGSSGVVDLKTTDFNSNWGEDGEAILELFKKDTLTLYLQLLKAGVAPEQARGSTHRPAGSPGRAELPHLRRSQRRGSARSQPPRPSLARSGRR